MKQFIKRTRKRFHELRYRLKNYRYWRAKGMGIRRAWAKADLTFH